MQICKCLCFGILPYLHHIHTAHQYREARHQICPPVTTLTAPNRTKAPIIKFLCPAAHGTHPLCDTPEDADLVLFVEDAHFDDYLFKQLAQHPLVQTQAPKCFMYNEVDRPWSILPGLYCSMPRWGFESGQQRAFPYAATPNAYIADIHAEAEREFTSLFSFAGAGCNRLRRRMRRLAIAQGGSIRDTSGFNVWDCSEDEKALEGKAFADTLRSSPFVLCPRGLGTSSFRLFETLQAGRVPVIIADNWVPPAHFPWDFAVHIPENQLHTLASRLQALSGEATERGLAARRAWETHYAPSRYFHTACSDLAQLRVTASHPRKAYLPTLRREHVRITTTATAIANRLKLVKRRLSST